jgi:hypothetical protein
VLGRLNVPAAPLSAETALQVAPPPLANTARYDTCRGETNGRVVYSDSPCVGTKVSV